MENMIPCASPTEADGASAATKTAARERPALQAAISDIKNNLARQLRAAEMDERQHQHYGAPRSTYAAHGDRALGPRLLERRARSNIRAATRRLLPQEQAEAWTGAPRGPSVELSVRPRPAPGAPGAGGPARDDSGEPTGGDVAAQPSPTQRQGSPRRAADGKRIGDYADQRHLRESEDWSPQPSPRAEPRRAGKSAAGRARARKRKREREAQTRAERLPPPEDGAPLTGEAPKRKRVRATPRPRRRRGVPPEGSSPASQQAGPTPSSASSPRFPLPSSSPLGLPPLGKPLGLGRVDSQGSSHWRAESLY